MRRALTLFTDSGIATVTTATALAAFTTLTLVAGGLVVTGVMDADRDRTVLALPAIGDPLGPIVIERDDQLDRPLAGVDGTASDRQAQARTARRAAPIRTVSLTDVDRVRGTVTTALDAGESGGRMEEVGPMDQIESIIKNSQDGHNTSDEGEADASPETEPAPEDPDDGDDGVMARVTTTAEETVPPAEDASATELLYSGTEVGSASPPA